MNICLTASTALLAAILFVPAQETKATSVPHKAVVDEWFGIFEDSLSDLELTRGYWEDQVVEGKTQRVFVDPKFGMSRLPMLRGHQVARQTEMIGQEKQEKARVMLEESGLEIAVWGFGSRTEPISAKSIGIRFRSMSGYDAGFKDDEVKKLVTDSYDEIVKGRIVVKNLGEWQFQSRLMDLPKTECLSCHTNNKVGDPVAIFMFATKPAR